MVVRCFLSISSAPPPNSFSGFLEALTGPSVLQGKDVRFSEKLPNSLFKGRACLEHLQGERETSLYRAFSHHRNPFLIRYVLQVSFFFFCCNFLFLAPEGTLDVHGFDLPIKEEEEEEEVMSPRLTGKEDPCVH